MKSGNKIWTIALILIVLTLIGSSFVSAGIVDTVTGFFGNIRNSAGSLWDRIDNYVMTGTFWINIGIVFLIAFILVQSYDVFRNLREGRTENRVILYIALTILAIVVAVQLGPTRIYHHQYIRWLVNINILINIAVVFIALEIVFAFFPQIMQKFQGGEGQGQIQTRIIRFLIPLIISLIIVYHAAQVDTNGIPRNTKLIWETQYWMNIERLGFGERAGGFGSWTGTYISNGQTRYGVLYWKPVPSANIPPPQPPIAIGNWMRNAPNLPPIVILLIIWLLLRVTLGGILRRALMNGGGDGQEGQQNNVPHGDTIADLLVIYLAVILTASGVPVNSLLLFARIFLFYSIYRAIERSEIRTIEVGAGARHEMSFISQAIISWILSGLVLRLFLDRNAPVNFNWMWSILAFEMFWYLMPYLFQTFTALLTALGWPGLLGIVLTGGIGSLTLGRNPAVRQWITDGLNLIPNLIFSLINSLGGGLQKWVTGISPIVVPIKSAGNKENALSKLFEGKRIGGYAILFIIVMVIARGSSVNIKPEWGMVTLAGIIGGIVGILIAKKGWVRRSTENLNKAYGEELRKFKDEKDREYKSAESSPQLTRLIGWLRRMFAQNRHKDAVVYVMYGKREQQEMRDRGNAQNFGENRYNRQAPLGKSLYKTYGTKQPTSSQNQVPSQDAQTNRGNIGAQAIQRNINPTGYQRELYEQPVRYAIPKNLNEQRAGYRQLRR